jgi:hypothetical protein
MRRRAAVLGVFILLGGCGDDDRVPGNDAGAARTDAGTRADGGSNADAGDTDAGAEPDPDAGSGLVEIANVRTAATCPLTAQHGTYPSLPGEAGHYAAARLEPPSYPFEVRSIAYDLLLPAGVAQCDASLAHEVQVYVASADSPPAMPSSDDSRVATLAVPSGAAAGHTNELELPEPVTLEAGESLFVAVQLAAGAGATTSLCIGACGEGTAISDVDFWSNAAAEPFAWADMVDEFGFTNNFMIRAYGSPR